MIDELSHIEEKYKKAFKVLLADIKKRKEVDSTENLEQAFLDLVQTRQNEKRSGGKDYVLSMVEAARIGVNDIGLGRTSLISLFVYHAIEKKQIDITAIEKKYGEAVALIVDGLSKVMSIEEITVSSQAENFRRLLLNLAKDVRVILIILAERLEYMRELKHMSQEEQIRAASEAAYLYAPLAHRLGLYLVKTEMEDISLKYTDRKTYNMIAHKLDETMRERQEFIEKFITPIESELKKQGFDFEVKGRPKSIFSIWNKMRKKEVSFEDIYDLFAIRIILNTELKNEKSDCWQVYSAVTDIYQPNPLRMRDWISVPKSNGYESLHTTVIGPDGKWVEVQIRTSRMNEIAEKGVAAHWKYKSGDTQGGVDNWLAKIREILETPEPDADNFIDDFKLSLYSKEIFVFTPKGDLRKFPEGATVLDFAYDIHTGVGGTCTGGKINGKVVPIRHKLQNGDKVEILTSKLQKPKIDWLNIVTTTRAQKKIRQALNEEQAKGAAEGKEMVKRRFKNWKIEYNDEIIRRIMKRYKLPNAQEFYYQVSTQKIDLSDLKDFINEEEKEEAILKGLDDIAQEPKSSSPEKSTNQMLIIAEQLANIDYKLAKCCNPIMGDSIFGFVAISEGIKIHRTNCPNAAQLIGKYGYRVVPAKWTRKSPDSVFPVNIHVKGEDQKGILHSISEVFAKDNAVTVRSININTVEGAFHGIIGLAVRDLTHLDSLLQKLTAIKGVYSVNRLESNA
ncbi:MAG: bifunctional (p)ppGpp synthetase/guanosine-3',5'-bis(diphosphate) 3'-pyrophosphohydrolase [Bacteroidota bacterium]|nr:MAG: bifunctional (p)ppGpp synthetase/guanosine-3',5'-bis(diphosphate) 3'-pyrophosphohydrolase [Bacteroidota bacterium]